MADFREVKTEDKEWIEKIFENGCCPSLEYNFTTIFIWRKIYNTRVSSLQNGDFFTASVNNKSFLFPTGNGNIKNALDEIFDYCNENNISPSFYSLTKKNMNILENFYPDRFEYTLNRDGADYIYEQEKLSTLSGKKLASKRNHINSFVQTYENWRYEPITGQNMNEVFEMNKQWCKIAGCENESALKEEGCAVLEALNNFDELMLSGGLIRANGKVVAFSVGDKLNDDTFLVHIEKAFPDIRGAYPIINREFVIHNCENFKYINREDDTGDEGLRKAKLSYKPVEILEKWDAVSKGV